MNIFLLVLASVIILALLFFYHAVKNAQTISEDYDHDEIYHGYNESKKPKQDE